MRKHLLLLSCLGLGAAAGPAVAQPTADPPAPPPAPEPAPEPAPAPAPAVEPDVEPAEPKPLGKALELRSEDGNYAAKLGLRVQPFYTLTRTTGPVDFRSAFEIRRARLSLDGHLHSKRLGYKFQVDFGKGFLTLKDFVVDVELGDEIWLRAGQWKRPFSRQQITSSGRQQLTDRAITDRAFGAGRDIGIALRNDYEKSPELEWTVGVFNGFTADRSTFSGDVVVDPITGEGEVEDGSFTNVPAQFKPAIVGRVGLNRGGLKGYSEADLEGGPLRYGVAASVWLEADHDDDDRSNQKAELDYVVKAHGFSTTGGIYAMTDQDGPGVLDATLALVGFHLQAGYMVVPKQLEIAARYALLSDQLDGDMRNTNAQELTIGGNYFAFAHDAKLVAALRLFKNGDAAFTDQILFELGANIGF